MLWPCYIICFEKRQKAWIAVSCREPEVVISTVVVVVVVVDHVTLVVDGHDVVIAGEHRGVTCGQRL